MTINIREAEITVLIADDELEQLGLSFEALRKRELNAVIFLAALKTRLHAEDAGELNGEIRVRRQKNGVMLVMTACPVPEYFFTAEQAAARCSNTEKEGELYAVGRYYALVFPESDPVETAKIKEHGRLICHTPVKSRYQT